MPNTNDIWAVCKDPGGTAGILPVVDELTRRGYQVQLFADGKAVDLLPAIGRTFTASSSAEMLMSQDIQRPQFLITSMCSGGGIGRDLVPLLHPDTTVVALQDTYGARLNTDWSESRYRPDFICVNDKVGADIVHRVWSDFDEKRISITGYPALDRYIDYNAQESAYTARLRLGLIQDKPIVVYCGQVDKAGQALRELVATLNTIERDVYLIIREHARMRDDAPSEIGHWQAAIAEFKAGTLISDTAMLATQTLLASATVIVSMYSTVLIEAAVLRKPNIALLYPCVGMQQFLSDTGHIMDELPSVILGCTAKASDSSELEQLLLKSFDNQLDLRAAQERYFCLDGLNARRVADLIDIERNHIS